MSQLPDLSDLQAMAGEVPGTKIFLQPPGEEQILGTEVFGVTCKSIGTTANIDRGPNS